jgi:hypothetical protein
MKKNEFVKASNKHTNLIYTLWKQSHSNSLLFGLGQSIMNGFVYLYKYDNVIHGFVKVNLSEKTLDHLRINELCLNTDDVIIKKFFVSKLDDLILRFGYLKAKIVMKCDENFELLINGGWRMEGKKFSADYNDDMQYRCLLAKSVYKVMPNIFGTYLRSVNDKN